MDQYFVTMALLGVDNGNLPAHRGMRQKRYESVEKMLDLTDVIKRIGPQFPYDALFIDPHDPEWDDDMTYLKMEWFSYYSWMGFSSIFTATMLYNYNIMMHNKNLHFSTRFYTLYVLMFSGIVYHKYRKQVLRANLFDEYVQSRADELIEEREHLLHSEGVKQWVWYTCDMQETLARCHRQSYKNDATDFADSELLLQDFIRRYTDDTEE
jgi:hypothetical protein